VDDTIFAGPYAKMLEQDIRSLGFASDECDHSFQLIDEGEVGDFLGIIIEKQKGNAFLLNQTGLILKSNQRWRNGRLQQVCHSRRNNASGR
jgi:hypothetical protein